MVPVAALGDIVGGDQVLTDPSMVAGYTMDWTGRFVGAHTVVVRPGSTNETAAVVDLCRSAGIAIVPQGGNTGLVGGSVPLNGEIVVSLRRLNAIEAPDVVARSIVVGAGALLADVQAAAAAVGLRYAVDMGSRGSATIGGTIATNAGGLNLLRYGGTREQLLGVEAVLGNGAVVSAMSGLAKDNTGYHLPSLLCGSEGTLGIITAARLRLVPAMPCHATAMVAFESIDAAIAASVRWRHDLADLEALEVMLGDGVQLVATTFSLPSPLTTDHDVVVLVELAATADPYDDLAAAVASVDGVLDAAVATDSTTRSLLWRFRDEHTSAINRIGPPHKFDVTFPIAVLGSAVERVRGVIARARPDAHVWIFGHLGDGNLHVNVTGALSVDDELDDLVLNAVVEMGGSISAEHGIGTAKARHLPWQRSQEELDAMRAVRDALNPDRILNPAVLIP
jgi:FAD/FMN-containing dehydrogenase